MPSIKAILGELLTILSFSVMALAVAYKIFEKRWLWIVSTVIVFILITISRIFNLETLFIVIVIILFVLWITVLIRERLNHRK